MQFQTLLFLHSYKSFGCTKKNEGQMYVCNGLTKVSAIQTILKIGKKKFSKAFIRWGCQLTKSVSRKGALLWRTDHRSQRQPGWYFSTNGA